MIDFVMLLWFAAGALAGVVHVTMLRRSAHRLTAYAPLMSMLRLGMVATILVAAAVHRQLLATAAGWAVGFAALIAIDLLRPASRSQPTKASSTK